MSSTTDVELGCLPDLPLASIPAPAPSIAELRHAIASQLAEASRTVEIEGGCQGVRHIRRKRAKSVPK
jgi:hypothetical protein